MMKKKKKLLGFYVHSAILQLYQDIYTLLFLWGRGLQNGRWQVVLLSTKLGAFEVLGSPKRVVPLKVRRENPHPPPPHSHIGRFKYLMFWSLGFILILSFPMNSSVLYLQWVVFEFADACWQWFLHLLS